ncbi:putative C6 transcription factor [Talaromyces proteolyticus]|uniref:C6 transcription factor n=1 Tax=Talaromyces proteolyticus TaxID=1131652 RepID=A0AAD4L344_9EURO|nr:putative C6 transcription factor [Talaromyces proteolyticus]KAH8705052.1 putative C6 transcription factor [Talaromyces proteolyticus]
MEDIVRPYGRRASGNREFQRAYKACLSCRQKKAKCDVGIAGPPCARCRREQRQCVFSEKRSWARRPRNGVSEDRAQHNPHLSSRDEVDVRSSSVRNELTSSLMRNVVSSGNDALNLLFEAAAHTNSKNSDLDPDRRSSLQSNYVSPEGQYQANPEATAIGTNPAAPSPVEISHNDSNSLAVWELCRFVKMGWFTAKEAVTFVDLFFEHLSPLSPILTDFYRKHGNHYLLVTQEPFLCCIILMISSRHHVLPGIGGASRSFFIHHRLWQHSQNLIIRLMLGQERSSKLNTRTLGTIEALLLMSEWHPRALHFPPENDGWDSDMTVEVPGTIPKSNQSETSSSSNQWLQDVIEPARRSDRMSWMLLGSAFSLAHELGVFETEEREQTPSDTAILALAMHNKLRKQRVQQLLYIYINQLASRIGCMSLMPQNLNRVISHNNINNHPGSSDIKTEWTTFMDSWMDLTKLAKSVNDMLFPSASFAKQQLHSGRYIALLDHFRPLLTQWRNRHLDSPIGLNTNFYNILHIEYHYVRVYTHSFGMQAVVERALTETNNSTTNNNNNYNNTTTKSPNPPLYTSSTPPNTEIILDPIDYEFIQEVIDGSCQILKKVIDLAETDKLRFSPVRIFLRVTSSSIFLLKALSLGVRHAKLQESLDVLDRSIQALRSNILDDVHLASRYAILLEVHVSRLRRNLVASSSSIAKIGAGTTAAAAATSLGGGTVTGTASGFAPLSLASQTSTRPVSRNENVGDDLLANMGAPPLANEQHSGVINDDEWMFSLPFDPSMAPFGPGGGQLSGFDGGTLDFLWNLPG